MLNQAFLAQKLQPGVAEGSKSSLRPCGQKYLPGDGGKPIKANEYRKT
jgi:hypothetical protein